MKRHASDVAAALFNSVYESATVKNLHLANVDFKSSGYIAAGIATDNEGTIEGCSVSGTIETETNGYPIGGVVAGNNSTGIVRGCYSTATVTGAYGVGGVIGQNDGTVTACYSTGALTSTDNNTFGGVVGSHLGGTVSTCYWDCTGATAGVGEYDSDTLGEEAAVQVDGTTHTWETARKAMNEALSSYGWEFVENSDTSTKDAEPLKVQAVTAVE